MTIEDTYELSIKRIDRSDILTFHCNSNEPADLHNEEGKCCCWLSEHTYLLQTKQLGNRVRTIAGVLLTGPREDNSFRKVKFDILNTNDKWVHMADIQVHTRNETPFEINLSNIIKGFRFRQSAAIDHSRGAIYFGDKPIEDFTEDECSSVGYWHNGRCNLYYPIPSQLTNKEECESFGYYWCNECHPYPETCEDWLCKEDCETNGCTWIDGEGCWRLGTQVYEVEYTNPMPSPMRIPLETWGHVLYLEYTMALSKGSDTISVTSPIYVGGSYITSDRIIVTPDKIKVGFRHDWTKQSGRKYEGFDIKLGPLGEGFVIEYLKVKAYYIDKGNP